MVDDMQQQQHHPSSPSRWPAPRPLLRRNGALGSCELCRKAKIRCDHRRPTCGNCEARSAVCVYHPAPLTRRRQPAPDVPAPGPGGAGNGWFGILDMSNPSTSDTPRPHSSSHGTDNRQADEADPTPSASTTLNTWHPSTDDLGVSEDSSLPTSVLLDTHDETYYGRTSCTSIFTEPVQMPPGSSSGSENAVSRRTGPSLDKSSIELGCWIIGQVEHAATICTLAEIFVQKSQLSPVATLMPTEAIRTLQTLPWLFAPSKAEQWRTVQTITDNTQRTVSTSRDLSVRDFIALFGGERPRWDFLGLVFAWAGRMVVTGLPNASTVALPEGFSVASFAQRMMECSNACILLVRQLVVTTDVFIWSLYENLIFLTYQQGESSHAVWQRLGDLSDEIFALGLHREPREPHGLPPFLLQARKKVFHASYVIDKKIATYFGRPPRISARYCNSTLPLDMPDSFFLDGTSPVSSDDDPSTWNKVGNVSPATWIRVRSIIGQAAEKVLEISLDSVAATVSAAKVDDLLKHCQVVWDSIPNFLRYDEDGWKSTAAVVARTALSLVVFLEHLQNEFQLRRFWCHCHNQFDLAARDSLLDVSMRILTAAMILPYGVAKTAEMQKDQTWLLLHHAVPSAGVLATELRVRGQSGEPIPSWTSRSSIIRHTSVLISALEAASSPGDGNSHLCDSAAKALSRILSDVLDAPTPSMINEWPPMSPLSMAWLIEPNQDMLSAWSDVF